MMLQAMSRPRCAHAAQREWMRHMLNASSLWCSRLLLLLSLCLKPKPPHPKPRLSSWRWWTFSASQTSLGHLGHAHLRVSCWLGRLVRLRRSPLSPSAPSASSVGKPDVFALHISTPSEPLYLPLLVLYVGNGKTLMARAVAGESGVAFISSSASEFIEMYMGLGAARVRDLFNTVRGATCVHCKYELWHELWLVACMLVHGPVAACVDARLCAQRGLL